MTASAGAYLVNPMASYIAPHQDRTFAYPLADNRVCSRADEALRTHARSLL